MTPRRRRTARETRPNPPARPARGVADPAHGRASPPSLGMAVAGSSVHENPGPADFPPPRQTITVSRARRDGAGGSRHQHSKEVMRHERGRRVQALRLQAGRHRPRRHHPPQGVRRALPEAAPGQRGLEPAARLLGLPTPGSRHQRPRTRAPAAERTPHRGGRRNRPRQGHRAPRPRRGRRASAAHPDRDRESDPSGPEDPHQAAGRGRAPPRDRPRPPGRRRPDPRVSSSPTGSRAART